MRSGPGTCANNAVISIGGKARFIATSLSRSLRLGGVWKARRDMPVRAKTDTTIMTVSSHLTLNTSKRNKIGHRRAIGMTSAMFFSWRELNWGSLGTVFLSV